MKIPKFRYDLAYGDLPRAVFIERALERALRFGASERRSTELLSLEHLADLLEREVLLDLQREDFERVVVELPRAVVSVLLEKRGGVPPYAYMEVWAASRQAAKLEIARLKELIPGEDTPEREPIGFAIARREQ